MTIPGAASQKAAARTKARSRRAEAKVQIDAGAATATLLAEIPARDPRPVAGYLPIGTEIDPRPAMETLAETRPVCVPVMQGRDLPLVFRRWRPGCALARGPFGVDVPESGEMLTPAVLIVPLLAFDRAGFRLGYGGGFYDRTLETLRASAPVLAIGFAFAAQEMPAVPREVTDQKLDLIVTERAILRM
ncbi:MAG: 5-formyltetrahydrofolate cyclo-ligase [Pseudomonadota bacterium]